MVVSVTVITVCLGVGEVRKSLKVEGCCVSCENPQTLWCHGPTHLCVCVCVCVCQCVNVNISEKHVGLEIHQQVLYFIFQSMSYKCAAHVLHFCSLIIINNNL